LPPPVVLADVKERAEQIQEPLPTPPLSEFASDEPPRPRPRERVPAKSGSSSMPFVLAVVGVGLFLCLACGGVGAIWFVGTKGPVKRDVAVKFKDKRDRVQKMDKIAMDGFAKDGLKLRGFQPPPLPPLKFAGFKDGKLPPPPTPRSCIRHKPNLSPSRS
jgi:hypothetical protein